MKSFQKAQDFFKRLWILSNEKLIWIEGASLAFTSVISFIPILAFIYVGMDLFGEIEDLSASLESFILANVAPALGNELLSYINSIRKEISAQALGFFGVIGFIITSISMLYKLEAALNRIWETQIQRSLIRKITTYWTLMTMGPLLLIGSIILSSRFLGYIETDTGEISKIIKFISTFSSYFISMLLFTFLYLFVPNKKVNFKAAALSGALMGIIFEWLKELYASYAQFALQESIYGTLAALPLFLLWLNLLWNLVLAGGAFTVLLEEEFDG